MIGQNLADLTHPEFSANIADSLKPSLIVSTSIVDECVVSQHRQFFVKLKPSVSYSTSPSHSVRCVLCALSLSLSLSLSLFSSLLSSPFLFPFTCFACTYNVPYKIFMGEKFHQPQLPLYCGNISQNLFCRCGKGRHIFYAIINTGGKNFTNESK